MILRIFSLLVIQLHICICLVHCRDKNLEEEKELRKAAEDRLQRCLVDLYENKEINNELRERLPKANKTDRLDVKEDPEEGEVIHTDQEEGEISKEESNLVEGEMSRSPKHNNIHHTLDSHR